jgi:hypothetical protein
MKLKTLIGLIGALALLVYLPAAANACSVCWAGDGGPTDNAFNWSVLFLMAAPYTVVGSIAAWLFCIYRRSAVKRPENETEQPPVHFALNPEDSGR